MFFPYRPVTDHAHHILLDIMINNIWRRLYKLYKLSLHTYHYTSHVEAGWNTSTAALRVVESDEKEPRYLGYKWVTLSLANLVLQGGVGGNVDNLAV
jgi:hypothetical protein